VTNRRLKADFVAGPGGTAVTQLVATAARSRAQYFRHWKIRLLFLGFGQSVHPEDGFSRFHEIELVSGQELKVVRISLE
jgi:hypothetical protein